MYELKQYVELENVYQLHIKQNPDDDTVRQKMFQIYEALGKYESAYEVASQIKDPEILDEIKEHINTQIVFLDSETQEVLIEKYPTLFTPRNY